MAEQVRVPIANLKGPQGVQGVQGLPGTGAVPADEAVAGYIETEGASETQGAADFRYSRVTAVTEGAQMRPGAEGTSRDIAWTGHSLMYGQDTSATGTNPPVNGATQTRSFSPPISAFRSQAGFLGTGAVVVVDQTYPGDRTAEALTRWAGGSSGDLEFFWLDTNDALALGPGVPLDDAESSFNMTALSKRARDRGAAFVVVGGAPLRDTRDSWRVFAAAETQRITVERLGGIYVDVGELINDFSGDGAYWTDSTHLVSQVYSLIGARLAALLGPKGVHAPHVAPGRKFTWRDQVWGGAGTVEAVAVPNFGGSVLRLTVGTTIGMSFWADAPVVPLIKLRATADAVVGIYTNLVENRPRVYATIHGTGPEVVAVVGPPTTSPGPSSTVVRAETGSVDVLSIEYLPYDAASVTRSDKGSWRIMPLGGSIRASDSWDACVLWDSGQPLKAGAPQTTNIRTRWLFDVRLGSDASGVALGTGIDLLKANLFDNGIAMLRVGADLSVRVLVDGVATTTVVAGVFAATGTVNAAIEAYWNGTSLLIYVDGTLRHTANGLAYKYLMAGAIAGPSASGKAFVAGTVSAFQVT